MPYRRTDNVVRKLAARNEAILAAAQALAAEGGMGAVQVATVARRAGIAAGTIYRYFPSKTELLVAVIERLAGADAAALRQAGDAAPGPLSALCAVIASFAARAASKRRLTAALLIGASEPAVEAARVGYLAALAGAIEARIRIALAGGYLPEQDPSLAAPALVGAVIEGLVGPLAPQPAVEPGPGISQVQMITLFALRALGVMDARARGLVVQAVVPPLQVAV